MSPDGLQSHIWAVTILERVWDHTNLPRVAFLCLSFPSVLSIEVWKFLGPLCYRKVLLYLVADPQRVSRGGTGCFGLKGASSPTALWPQL